MSADTSQLRALSVTMRASPARARQLASQAVRKTAHDVEALAKTRAPVDTGALRNSISVTMDDPLAASIGPTVDYAPYLEFGTRRMAPKPFMGPAADAAMPGLEAALQQLGDLT